ncbi:Gfo/Idh/MocA family protein [Emticicia sp. C21]|uniref:Gfo/Idh/MocA family protein n=1 Tax=Emticicia sp. C21 TaxID=2302915 RepID=UPI000E3488E7|nr:Gfo/Idh/MocA family oxidoreductase [Emticicia sp. C21]RFS17379.1 gfo/Idh/MocA family oxidoreductase [Emticicia sp. C21]
MKNNRRDFLKMGGASALTLAANWDAQASTTNKDKTKAAFNMSGYAAPKLETVRIGFIGVGNRGSGSVTRVNRVEGVETKAICDKREVKARESADKLEKMGIKVDLYYENEDSWKKMCERPDIDLVYIATPWHLHTPMAVYAMKQGKHVAIEVPAATTMEECWQLVETSESTKKHCMMLENTCYDFFELLTLNMARQGYFGEIIHVEGAYLHDLRDSLMTDGKYSDNWRLKQNLRNGSLYPTHGLGPVSQVLNLNRGDRMDYLVSTSSNDFTLHDIAVENAKKDNYYQQFVDKKFRGNLNVTTIKTLKGKTIMIQHDVSTPRPYSRIHLVSGTNGIALKYPEPGRISDHKHEWLKEAELAKLQEEFTPPIVKKIGEMAKQVGGHGGMDFMMDWRMIDCLRNGIPLDQDVYDAALWSAVAPLSEASVKNRSKSIDVPDFTRGNWKTNEPMDITMSKGGNTGIRKYN